VCDLEASKEEAKAH